MPVKGRLVESRDSLSDSVFRNHLHAPTRQHVPQSLQAVRIAIRHQNADTFRSADRSGVGYISVHNSPPLPRARRSPKRSSPYITMDRTIEPFSIGIL